MNYKRTRFLGTMPPPPPPPPTTPPPPRQIIRTLHAVLTAPPECSTCPNQQSLLSLKIRSRSLRSSFASSSLDLAVATSSGLILQNCLIMALSFHCKHKFPWHGAWRCTHKGCSHGHGLRDVGTGSSSLNFFQAVFTLVVTASSQPPPVESTSSSYQKEATTSSLPGPT